MLVVTSPAKKLDWAEREQEMTWPALHDDAVALAEVAGELSKRAAARAPELGWAPSVQAWESLLGELGGR